MDNTVQKESKKLASDNLDGLRKKAFSVIMMLPEKERENLLRPYREKYGKSI